MGLTSSAMLDLLHVDPVIVAVRADPLDPDDTSFEVDSDDQTIIVALDVEHYPLAGHDAGRGVTSANLGGILPSRLAGFIEPRVERGLQRAVVSMAGTRFDESTQGPPGDDPHLQVRISLCPNWAQCGPASVARQTPAGCLALDASPVICPNDKAFARGRFGRPLQVRAGWPWTRQTLLPAGSARKNTLPISATCTRRSTSTRPSSRPIAATSATTRPAFRPAPPGSTSRSSSARS